MAGEVVRESPEDGVEEWFFRDQRDYWGNVGVARFDDAPDEWLVTVDAMEFVREDPLEAELRAAIASALASVPGAGDVSESDTEVWLVMGEPSGEQLALAADAVVDRFADQIAAYIDSL